MNDVDVLIFVQRSLLKTHADHRHLLRIPRRPFWTREMTAEELSANERERCVMRVKWINL